jgi:hypothetical protein
METATISPERLAEILGLVHADYLRDMIDAEREAGRAFGVVAEAARVELDKRFAL